ncbi:hypothetical protein AC1031_015600 [Aphanomyces cochlioides]|nr:hypothetical protein AC1031_015600 [Aphanomyces cochlioides]
MYDGVVDDLLAKCEYVRRISFETPIHSLSTVAVGRAFRSRYQYGVLVEEWRTEEVLHRHVAKQHVAIQWQTELLGYTYEPNGMIRATIVEAKDGQTTSSELVVKYIVGCDGGSSIVRKLMGCSFDGEVLPMSFVCAHFKPKTPLPMANDELRQCLGFDGASMVMPMPDATYFAAVDLTPDQDGLFQVAGEENHHGQPLQRMLTHEELQQLLSKRIKSMELESIRWQSHFRVNHRHTAAYADKNLRVFLAGDSARCHTPLLGQGMNAGIQDAVNLGWKIAFVVSGNADESLLATYDIERRALGAKTLAFLARSQAAFHSRGLLKHLVRNTVIWCWTRRAPIVEKFAATVGAFDINYQSSALTEPPQSDWLSSLQAWMGLSLSKVVAGQQAPRLTGHASTLFDSTPGFKLTIVLESQGAVTGFAVISSSDVENHALHGVHNRCVFIIRPDGYVGFRNENATTNDVLHYLSSRASIRNVASVKPSAPARDASSWMGTSLGLAMTITFGLAALKLSDRIRLAL